jgi:hypothetical protein
MWGWFFSVGLVVGSFLLSACGAGDLGVELLVIQKKGSGEGTVTVVSDENKRPNRQEGGIACGSRCQDWYYEGDALTLTATPDTDSLFSGWSGDCTGDTSPLSITLGDHGNTCIATFTSTSVQVSSPAVVVWEEDGDIFSAYSSDDGQTFGTPGNLSNSGAAFAPQLAIDGNTVLVAWEEGNSTILVVRSGDGGETFGDPLSLSDSGHSFSPRIVIEGNTVVVAWLEDPPGEIFTARSSDAGITFDEPVNRSNTTGDLSYVPNLAIENDVVVLTWVEDISGNDEIFMVRSTDAGITFDPSPLNLSASAVESFDPQPAIAGGVVLVTWEENGDILAIRSTDGGINFSLPAVLSNSGGAAFFPQMKVDGDNVLVVWEADGDVFAVHSDNVGASFSSPANLSNNGEASFATVATGGGVALVTWVDFSRGVGDIVATYSGDGGANFGALVNVSDTVGDSSLPHAALSDNTLLVTWGDDTAGGNDIYVARSTDGGAGFGNAVNVSNSAVSAGNPQIGFIP